MIDLHTHSLFSDGTDTPEQLIEKAVEKGLKSIALCDHDTISGLQRFVDYASGFPIHAIPGIEVSAEWEKGECHILGFGIHSGNNEFENYLKSIKISRDNRNFQICHQLQNHGIRITLEEVQKVAGGEIITRPHIAKVLVEKAYCSSIDEAFACFLGKDSFAYVERVRLQPIEAISLLKKNVTRVFLAHPSTLRLNPDEFVSFVQCLIHYGLDGIEVFSPYSSDSDTDFFLHICEVMNLRISGGSDYHGTNKPGHHLGYYQSEKVIPIYCKDAVL